MSDVDVDLYLIQEQILSFWGVSWSVVGEAESC